MGSCSTGVACIREGRGFVGVDVEEQYLEIAKVRLHSEYETIDYV